MPDSGTEATMAPLRRHMEQSQRRGSTMPSGRLSSSSTAPQWQLAVCLSLISVEPTCLITSDAPRSAILLFSISEAPAQADFFLDCRFKRRRLLCAYCEQKFVYRTKGTRTT